MSKAYTYEPDEELKQADANLLKLNPSLSSCTTEERIRFIFGLGVDKLEKVEKTLLEYLHFREHDLKQHREHLESLVASSDGSGESMTSTRTMFSKDFFRTMEVTEEKSTIDSTRILYVLPATFQTSDESVPLYKDDMTVAQYHSLTIAVYMDSMLPRDSYERFTIMLDARHGEGANFGNPGVFQVMPIMKEAVKIMQAHFTERLSMFVMFPLPSVAMYCWNVIKLFIDQESLSRYVLIGSDGTNSQIYSDPPVKLKEILDEEAILRLEKRRRDMFIEN